MVIVKHQNMDPYIALAIEDYIMDLFEGDCFMLWQTSGVVVVGKYQNIYSEVNLSFAESRGIPVIRRRSGGGAVYNDENTIYYTFVANKEEGLFSNYSVFTAPVVSVLNRLGIVAEQTGRNDITIEGKKISGNSQFVSNGKIVHHGTILFDYDEEILYQVLNADKAKLESNGVKSVKSRVTNIKHYLNQNISSNDFRNLLLDEIKSAYQDVRTYTPTEHDWQQIEQISKERYKNPEWTYGKNPKGTMRNTARFVGGSVEVSLSVEKNRIIEINFFGDFFSKQGVTDIEKALTGILYNKSDVQDVLNKFEFNNYFSNITIKDLLQLIFATN